MEFALSHHAEQEIKRRGIPMEMIRQTMESPEQILPERGGTKAYQSTFDFGSGKMYLVRVIVNDNTTPPVVVTTYRTSNISKYWRID